MSETFCHEKIVYLSDTNAEGNVYFAQYFLWQGIAREEFFRQNIPNPSMLLQSGLKMITVNAWMSYRTESRLFDLVQIKINTANIKPLSLELIFTFVNKASGQLIGRGGERLAFSGPEGDLIEIPEVIRLNAQRFLDKRAEELLDLGMKK